MDALLQPHILTAFARMYAHQAVMQTTWYFDMLFSYAVAFAIAYGLFICLGALFPAAPGRRPRVWAVPLLFAAVALAFPLFLDRFVASVLWNAQALIGLGPEMWIVSIVACVWLAGFAVTLARTLKGFIRLLRAARGLPVRSDSPALMAARAATGLGEAVTLRNGGPGSPIISCGLRRSCIVVPDDFAERYDLSDQYAILLHECIHIKNRDTFKLFCLALANTVLWFDPVAKHAIRRTKAETEYLCDWTAVHIHRLEPSRYAALILEAASGHEPLAPAFSEHYRILANRLHRVLGGDAPSAPATTRASRTGAAALLAGLLLLVVMSALFYAKIPAAPPTVPTVDAPLQTTLLAERRGVFAHYTYGVTFRPDE